MKLNQGGGFLINLWILRLKKEERRRKKTMISVQLFLYPLLVLGGRTGAGLGENFFNTLLGRSGVS